jgi:2-methylcitrate dehydratase PrpD
VADTVAAALADWSSGSAAGALPGDAIALVRRAFLDTIAVTLLGARMAAPRAVARVERARGATGDASVHGMGWRTDLLAAALINGTSSHAELFDDNNAPMIAHPSGPLVSALLPLAQDRQASGRDVVESYAVGFEIGVTLGRMLNPGLYERGWHVTRVLGVIGAAAACARLLGLDAERTMHALGIAVSMSSSVRQNFGTMTMPLHVGLTARDAIHAALLAEAGLTADPAALDGKYGLFRTFAEQSPSLPALGGPWELCRSGIIFKPYPSGAPTLAAVDAALTLRERIDARIERITRVTCLVHRWNAMTLRAEAPRDPLQAKVNLRFCVAAALVHGRLTWREFSAQALADPVLQAMMQRIDIAISDDLPDNDEFPAEVRVALSDGAVLTHRNDTPPGGSSRPLDEAALVAKFDDCATAVLDAPLRARVVADVMALDTLAGVGALCDMLEGTAARD